MPDTVYDERILREYLLGILDDESVRDEIEQRLFTDPEFLEAVLAEEEELISDHSEGVLTDAERSAYERNFVRTPERLRSERLTGSLRSRANSVSEKSESARSIFDIFGSFQFQLAAGAAVVLICVGLVWFFTLRNGGENAAMASLNKAFENERPHVTRIAGFDYAPAIERRSGSTRTVNDVELRRAELLILDAVSGGENAETLAALGRLQLAKGEYDKAVATFSKLKDTGAADAQALSDLGAAYIGLADHAADDGSRLKLNAQAVEALDAAIAADPKLPEPRFNRAIALGRLGLRDQQIAAWRDYLEIDGDSQWANEARSRLAALEAEPPREHSGTQLLEDFWAAYRVRDKVRAFEAVSRDREMITGKLVFQQLAFLFADEPSSGERSVEIADAMSFIGEIEHERSGDGFWRDLARYYKSVDDVDRKELKNAQDAVRDGYRLTLDGEYTEAAERFRKARSSFAAARNPYEAAIADYWLAYSLQQLRVRKEPLAIFSKQAAAAKSKGYLWLESQMETWLGQIAFFDDDLSGRLRHNARALELAEKAIDPFQVTRINQFQATTYVAVGSTADAVRYMAASLAAGTNISMRQRYRTLNSTTQLLGLLGLYSSAFAFESEAYALNREVVKEHSYEYFSLLTLGQIEAKRGRLDSALEYFRQSRESAAGFDERSRPSHLGYVDVSEGNALRSSGRCDEAIERYDRTVAGVASSEFQMDRYDAHRGLLMCYIATRQDERVSEQTDLVLGLLDQYREKIREESTRNSFFSGEQEVFDALIAHQMDLGQPEKAFEFAELSRSRSLLDMMHAPTAVLDGRDGPAIALPTEFTKPLELGAIRKELPADVQLLQYAVLTDRIAVWSVTADGFAAAQHKLETATLETAAAAFIRSLSAPATNGVDDRLQLGEAVASAMIRPFVALIDPKRKVVVIPDKVLAKVPFGALPGLNDNDFLIRDFELHYAPSSSVYVIAARNAEQHTDERILAVGDPAFDRERFAGLPQLSGAAREAAAIRSNYSNTTMLSGREATPNAIVDAMDRANVFHFAGHYIYDPASPLRSGLLAAGRGDDSLLPNEVIAGKRFSRLQLVVLSGCRTGSEQVLDGEGILGAARIFLASGIPQVVASHWDVDSESTADLMIDFHKIRRSNGSSTTRALRQAQLSMLDSPDTRERDPYYWAPFFSFGA